MPALRMSKILAKARFGRRLGVLDEGSITFRVWPNDLDINLHMNNGRYLTLMDLGRYDLIARLGLFREIRRRGWFPVVGSATIRFRRSLRLGYRFEIRTRVLGWDQKWLYLEQRFLRRGDVVAVGRIKGLFRTRSGPVPTQQVLALVGHTDPSPPLPRDVALWDEADRLRPAGT